MARKEPKRTEPVFIDMPPNDDWIRYISWDFYASDEEGRHKPIETIDELLSLMGTSRYAPVKEQLKAIEWFMTKVPSAKAMPQHLRKQLKEYLEELRKERQP